MFSSNTSQVSNDAVFIEDVFSTYLYTGNGSQNQNITNGIDLAGKGGLVWIKSRNVTGLDDNWLQDTARGIRNGLKSNSTAAQSVNADLVTAVLANGYTDSVGWGTSDLVASWTFRKQPKFFDVVTYTGNGAASRQISHNLTSVPGCLIVKKTSTTSSWFVWHRAVPGDTTQQSLLNLESNAGAELNKSNVWPVANGFTSTYFTVGSTNTNENGVTYVAYLFAHNAGGFGLTGTDNVISCGSYTGTGALNTISLGYEPQWIMVKNASVSGDNWVIIDNMRGFPAYSTIGGATLFPNTSDAENSGGAERFSPTATGFQVWDNAGINNASGNTYIYIAIRRGPMKTPTTGTSVYNAVTVTGNGTANRQITGYGFPLDLLLSAGRTGSFLDKTWNARLTGAYYLRSTTTAAEDIQYGGLADPPFAYMDGYKTGTNPGVQFYWNYSGETYVQYGLRRAPSFMDVVAYSGTDSATTVSHNLGVVPELMIVKSRGAITNWAVYSSAVGATKYLRLNATNIPSTNSTFWNNTAPTSTVFSVGGATETSGAFNYVAYLFASCPGVSKVGSYTGTGATQTINCGFAARFVLIKRTDSTGDWFVWDTARGMVAGTDPRLALNSTAAETNANWVYTNASGFQIVTTDASVNASGGSYIFLAIA